MRPKADEVEHRPAVDVRFARRSARAFVESSESIDPALFLAMLAVFTEREA